MGDLSILWLSDSIFQALIKIFMFFSLVKLIRKLLLLKKLKIFLYKIDYGRFSIQTRSELTTSRKRFC